MSSSHTRYTRRELLSLVGAYAGSALLYESMATLGFAEESPYRGPPSLSAAPKGARVVVLGAGLAGLAAACELRRAGYDVQVLEYNDRVGGRSWTIRGGDRFTELGGAQQSCGFSPGLYMNPGPWRIAHHHRAILDYCRRLRVPLEPFIEINYNGYLHSTGVFGGKPQRMHAVFPDFQGYVAEMLAKASNQHKLDELASEEDAQLLRETLRMWAGLDSDFRYVKGAASARMRGVAGVDFEHGTNTPGEPLPLRELLQLSRDAGIWRTSNHSGYRDLHNPMFQPVGGMDMIAKAFARELPGSIQFNSRVVSVQQDGRGVTVAYEDARAAGPARTMRADWCICTIPLSVLSQIDLQVGDAMKDGIAAVYYSTSMKAALQFKRRFWERDDGIYGGFSHTNLPISTLAYPSHGLNEDGPAVMYGAFSFGTYSYEFSGMTPEQRVRKVLEYGQQIHPQYPAEFDNGVAVAWHRVPWSLGCFAVWRNGERERHFENLRAMDGRFVLAGEALATAVGGWQEGAILSGLDAAERIHRRVVNV